MGTNYMSVWHSAPVHDVERIAIEASTQPQWLDFPVPDAWPMQLSTPVYVGVNQIGTTSGGPDYRYQEFSNGGLGDFDSSYQENYTRLVLNPVTLGPTRIPFIEEAVEEAICLVTMGPTFSIQRKGFDSAVVTSVGAPTGHDAVYHIVGNYWNVIDSRFEETISEGSCRLALAANLPSASDGLLRPNIISGGGIASDLKANVTRKLDFTGAFKKMLSWQRRCNSFSLVVLPDAGLEFDIESAIAIDGTTREATMRALQRATMVFPDALWAEVVGYKCAVGHYERSYLQYSSASISTIYARFKSTVTRGGWSCVYESRPASPPAS